MAERRTFVITGGAGFIGANLAAGLARLDGSARLMIVDDFSSGTFANVVRAFERQNLEPFRGEVMASTCGEIDWESVIEEASPEAIFHLAAITDTTVSDERRMIEANSEEFRGLLWACVQSGTPLVYASSAATYGTPAQVAARKPFPLDAAGRPNNVYGFSKWLMECDHASASESHRAGSGQLPWVVGLRYFNVFGPGEGRKGKMSSMVHQMARRVLAGGHPRMFTDGSQARDQVHVDDVVACTMAAAGLGSKRRPTPGVYNVGSGRATTFNEIADAVREALGLSASERSTEYFDMPADIRAFYQDYTCADMAETERGLGFTPRINPLEGVRTYVSWLRSHPGA